MNPLIAYRARSTNLGKVKTDAVDAYLLCKLYKEEVEPCNEVHPFLHKNLFHCNLRILPNLYTFLPEHPQINKHPVNKNLLCSRLTHFSFQRSMYALFPKN
ncbi:hypothetical protein [Metabacillus niabensis]|uniref:hypothetical protein n=1 Tax=Metabacillus niabensis TaxID=324854 RepID=UPI0039AEF7EA